MLNNGGNKCSDKSFPSNMIWQFVHFNGGDIIISQYYFKELSNSQILCIFKNPDENIGNIILYHITQCHLVQVFSAIMDAA